MRYHATGKGQSYARLLWGRATWGVGMQSHGDCYGAELRARWGVDAPSPRPMHNFQPHDFFGASDKNFLTPLMATVYVQIRILEEERGIGSCKS